MLRTLATKWRIDQMTLGQAFMCTREMQIRDFSENHGDSNQGEGDPLFMSVANMNGGSRVPCKTGQQQLLSDAARGLYPGERRIYDGGTPGFTCRQWKDSPSRGGGVVIERITSSKRRENEKRTAKKAPNRGPRERPDGASCETDREKKIDAVAHRAAGGKFAVF